MFRKKILTVAMVFAAAGLGGTAFAQGGMQGSTGTTQGTTGGMQGGMQGGTMPGGMQGGMQGGGMEQMQGVQFDNATTLKTLHAINLNEEDAGKMAKKQTSNKQVKEYAEHLSSDHSSNDKKISSLAKNMNVKLTDKVEEAGLPQPVAMQLQQSKQTMEGMKKMKGAQFDQGFLTQMVQGHQFALNFLQQAQTQVTDPQVKSLVGQTIPSIQQHLQQAQTLLQSVGTQGQGGSGMQDTSGMDQEHGGMHHRH